MNGHRRKLKRGLLSAVAAFLMLAATLVALAVESAAVMEQHVTEDSVLLYIKHKGESLTVDARVGTEPASNVTISGTDGNLPIVTWLLVDNSISIDKADRNKTKQLLTDLVAGRAADEQFNLCTFNDKLGILMENSQSYPDLKAQIDAIEYINQETYLTDVLDEVLDRENQREELAFVRVVVISDGVDNNPGGLTREELNRHLEKNSLPIYTLGCKRKDNDHLLKEMYSLSRQTNGLSWSLSDMTDTLAVSQTLNGDELPVCVTVEIPEKLRDGSQKGLQVTFGDGTVAESQASMPFGSVTPAPEPEPESAPKPEPTPDPEPEPGPGPGPKKSMLIPILILAIALVVAVVAVVVVLLGKKKKERIESVDWTGGSDVTEVDDGYKGGDTVILVNNDSRLMLSLTDRVNPNRHFEAPLRDKVTVGRNPENQIVLNYEKSVSGTHCEIFMDGSIFKIRDLKSKNGTYVDGIRVGDVAEISNGSTIKLGRLEMVVEIR